MIQAAPPYKKLNDKVEQKSRRCGFDERHIERAHFSTIGKSMWVRWSARRLGGRWGGLGLEAIDEIDDYVRTGRVRRSADVASRNGHGKMRLAGAGPADQHGLSVAGLMNRRRRDRRPAASPSSACPRTGSRRGPWRAAAGPWASPGLDRARLARLSTSAAIRSPTMRRWSMPAFDGRGDHPSKVAFTPVKLSSPMRSKQFGVFHPTALGRLS